MNRYEEIEISGKMYLISEMIERIRDGETLLGLEQRELDCMVSKELGDYFTELVRKWEATQKRGKEKNVPPPSDQEKEADEPQVEIRKPNCNEEFEESVKILEAAGKAEKMITASRVWQEKAKNNEYCRKIFFPAFRDRVILIAKQL